MDADPGAPLGVARDGAPFLSRLLLFWVNPLVRKGRAGAVGSAEDVFELPGALRTEDNSRKFQEAKVGRGERERE